MAEEVTFLHGNNIYQNQFEILTVKWLKMGNGRTDRRHTPFLKQLHFVAANKPRARPNEFPDFSENYHFP